MINQEHAIDIILLGLKSSSSSGYAVNIDYLQTNDTSTPIIGGVGKD